MCRIINKKNKKNYSRKLNPQGMGEGFLREKPEVLNEIITGSYGIILDLDGNVFYSITFLQGLLELF